MVIAVELHEPKGFGRVRMRRVPDASGANLLPFVRESIEPGSEVLTDAWGGYNDMTKSGYTRITTNLSDSGDPPPYPDARCPPHRLSAQTLAARNSPRCCKWPAPRLLPRRIHVSLQPAHLSLSWASLLPPNTTGRGDNTGVLPPNRQQPGPQHIGVTCVKWIARFFIKNRVVRARCETHAKSGRPCLLDFGAKT